MADFPTRPPANSQRLFAYLDIRHPLVAWEVAIGRIQSAGLVTEGFGISLWEFAQLRAYAEGKQFERFRDELRLEELRRNLFPSSVSRLKGLYFFRSLEDANTALARWNIPSRRRYLSEIAFSPSAVSEVDSEWITSNLGRSNDDGWMERYWSGKFAGERPLPEVLGIGKGIVLNKDLRIQAYRRIFEKWPTSTPLLAAACSAFQRAGLDNVALVTAALFEQEEIVRGDFAIYMDEFDNHQQQIVAAVEECKKDGTFPPVNIPADGETFFTLPNLRHLAFEVRDISALKAFRQLRSDKS